MKRRNGTEMQPEVKRKEAEKGLPRLTLVIGGGGEKRSGRPFRGFEGRLTIQARRLQTQFWEDGLIGNDGAVLVESLEEAVLRLQRLIEAQERQQRAA